MVGMDASNSNNGTNCRTSTYYRPQWLTFDLKTLLLPLKVNNRLFVSMRQSLMETGKGLTQRLSRSSKWQHDDSKLPKMSPLLLPLSVDQFDADKECREAGRKGPLELVRATDYATPEKYLNGTSKIPSYYVFQSNMVADEDLKPGMLRNLEVDRRLTLPTRTHIRFLVTATDVIHSWAVPALGIKADAVPGRLHRVTCFIQREGVYYGQCSELCGALHAFMPIVVEAVSPQTYAAHAKKHYHD